MQHSLDLFKQIQEERIPIIVEGKNDVKALKELGFEFFYTLRKPIYKIMEELHKQNIKQIIILTDFDVKGKELYKKIKSECSQRGIRIFTKLRSELRKTDVVHIEGLDTYITNFLKKS